MDGGAVLVALWLLACIEEDALSPCRDGFVREADGHCHPPVEEDDPVDVEQAFADLPPCEVGASPDGALDIARGCADGACVGATEAEITAALGEPPVCVNVGWSATDVYCTWSNSIEGLFDDLDADSWADPYAVNERVHLYPGYEGETVDGLGVGATPRCFLDVLGLPDRLVYTDVGGNLVIQDMIWDAYGFQAYDWGWDDGSGLPDGHLDNLYLYGAP